MGQRSETALPTRPIAKTWDDFIQCEVTRDEHEVHPTVWPPPRTGTIAGDPSMALPCVHCGATSIVYKGHATGELRGVRVVLPNEKKKTA